MNQTDKINIINSFVKEIKSIPNLQHCLNLAVSNQNIFNISEPNIQTVSRSDWQEVIREDTQYDLILGDFPLETSPINYQFGNFNLSLSKSWANILSSLKRLKTDGIAIFIAEPNTFASKRGMKIVNALNAEGYYINGIFNAPQGILEPESAVTPLLILITQTQTDYHFIGELLNEFQAKKLANNYFDKISSNDLTKGINIPNQTFRSFNQIKIKQQIEKLETQYKEFEEYTLSELAKEINYVKSGNSLTEKENSVYIPQIGNSSVISKLSEAKIKHHNYFQVVLCDKAINEYIVAFFRSDLGKLILQSLTLGAYIPRLNKGDLEQVTVALPPIPEQEQILATQQKMYDLKQAIDDFDKELALNPTSSNSMLGQLDAMLDVIGSLTDTDKVRNLIRQGESKTVEFKETLSLDVKKQTGKKEKYIEEEVLKTIVAFLNTEGGTLLIGVNDNGDVTGIDIEIKKFYQKNTDKFLLHFKNRVKEKIGEEFYPYFEYKVISINDYQILMVECSPSESPCFLDGKEFYVRTNPASDKLEGQKLIEYIKNHFNQ